MTATDWGARIVRDDQALRTVLGETRTIAVLGIKTEQQAGQPSIEVPRYMQAAGYRIIPVPVYFPDATEILGEPVVRACADAPVPVDMVNVFRRSKDVLPHVDDIIAARPRSVWLQLGIRNDEAAERLARAGITVVQDRCLMVDHARLTRR
ncbi:MAG TPA: CoA-binding protein [Blastocatellia bacterium]|nr:CoA-binding protein [Blastocatellia bacterium]